MMPLWVISGHDYVSQDADREQRPKDSMKLAGVVAVAFATVIALNNAMA